MYAHKRARGKGVTAGTTVTRAQRSLDGQERLLGCGSGQWQAARDAAAGVRQNLLMVSEIFEPDRWRAVEGFAFTDITYHRAVDSGTVRVAFDRARRLGS